LNEQERKKRKENVFFFLCNIDEISLDLSLSEGQEGEEKKMTVD